MQEILDKYDTTGTPYLLPIIKVMNKNERKQYENALRMVNNKLKEIAKTICLPIRYQLMSLVIHGRASSKVRIFFFRL